MRRSVRARNARIQAINAAKPIRNFKPAEFMHVGSGGHTRGSERVKGAVADIFISLRKISTTAPFTSVARS